MKATEQYFPVLLFIMLYKVILTSKSVDEMLKCDHSNESYWAVLSCGAVYSAVQVGWVCWWFRSCPLYFFFVWLAIFSIERVDVIIDLKQFTIICLNLHILSFISDRTRTENRQVRLPNPVLTGNWFFSSVASCAILTNSVDLANLLHEQSSQWYHRSLHRKSVFRVSTVGW